MSKIREKVYALCFNSEGEILLVKNKAGELKIPGGGYNRYKDDDSESSILRMFKSQTGALGCIVDRVCTHYDDTEIEWVYLVDTDQSDISAKSRYSPGFYDLMETQVQSALAQYRKKIFENLLKLENENSFSDCPYGNSKKVYAENRNIGWRKYLECANMNVMSFSSTL